MLNTKKKSQGILGLSLTILLVIVLIAPVVACKRALEPLQITLSPLEGKVEYRVKDTGQWLKAIDGQLIALNDHVRTRLISRAVLYLPDGSKFLLAPATELTVEVFEQEADTRVARLRLIKGAVDGDVATFTGPGSLLEIVTEDSVVAVVGTKLKVENREGRDFSVDLLEGVAYVAHVSADETTGQPRVDFFTQTEGTVLSLPKNAGTMLSSEVREEALRAAEAIVSSGLEAMNEVRVTGDIRRGLDRAREVARASSARDSTLRTLGIEENILDGDTTVVSSAFIGEDMAVTEDGGGKVELGNGISVAMSVLRPVEGILLGEEPELDDLINRFEESFKLPQPIEIFNGAGVKIGEQPPPVIVFDPSGEPIGKQPVPPVMFGEQGAPDVGQLPPNFVMIKDPFSDKLISIAPAQLMLPTFNAGEGGSGLQGQQLAPPITFDEAGNLQTTIITYDERGVPTGIVPFTEGQLFDESGIPTAQARLPFVEFENGRPVGQRSISMVLFDADRKAIELEIPPPIIFDEQNRQVAMQGMPVFLMNDMGRPLGIEAGQAFTPEGELFMPFSPPLGGLGPGGAMPPPIVYHADGTPVTVQQFRPMVIMRDEAGNKVGEQPTPERWFANPEEVMRMGEQFHDMLAFREDIPVVLFDSTGALNVVELTREVFFDKDGRIAGEQPPPFLVVEAFGKPTGLYEAGPNLWAPPPPPPPGNFGFDDGMIPPPPGGWGPEGPPMEGFEFDGGMMPPPPGGWGQ